MASPAGQLQPRHLVVTDLVMPEMGGRELSERIRSLRASLPILHTSGYPSDSQDGANEPKTPDEWPLDHFLAKPFGPADLAHKVRSILDRN